MQVSSKVIIDRQVITALKKAQIKALEYTAEDLHTEVVQAQVFPRMDGTLQNESTFVDCSKSSHGTVSIVSATPYARRLYYHPEYHFHKEPWEEEVKHKDGTVETRSHDGNPNAKGKWYEDWEDGEFVKNQFMKHFRRLSGL